MKLAALAALIVLSSLPAIARDDTKELGQPSKDEPIVKFVHLFESPTEYLGNVVRVEGMVVRLDEEKGAWVDIANDTDGATIRIHMPPVGTSLPPDATGRVVVAEGVFRKVDPKRDPSRSVAVKESDSAAGIASQQAKKAGAGETSYEILASGAVFQ